MLSPQDPAFVKLANVLGHDRAHRLASEILVELKFDGLDTPDQRLAFGNALQRRGGLLAAIGTAIRVQAFLMGASDGAR